MIFLIQKKKVKQNFVKIESLFTREGDPGTQHPGTAFKKIFRPDLYFFPGPFTALR